MKKRDFLRILLFTAGAGAGSLAFAGKKHRIAVVYFSKSGHTQQLAESVKFFAQADLYRIETVRPYPQEYGPATEVVKDELENGVIRELKPLSVEFSRYDTVILATPTWWHHAAVPLQTWIRSAAEKLGGKLILTANTHGGGGLMHTREDFEKLLAGKKLGTHLTVFGGPARDSSEVKNWLSENGLI